MKQSSLFDWKKRAANKARAFHWQHIGRNEGADFLLQNAADDLALRLSTLDRKFQSVLLSDYPGTEDTVASLQAVASPFLKEANWTLEPQRVTKEPATIVGEPSRFDMAISILGLQDFDQLPERLKAIQHALKPDGLFLSATIGGETLKELRQSLLAVEPDFFGGVRPRIHPMISLQDMGALMQRTGFALLVTDVETYQVNYDDIFALVQDLRAMGATKFLRSHEERNDPTPISRNFWPAVNAHYLKTYGNEKGRIPATFEIIWSSGWAPAANQPKPLKPGSATHSLGDALKKLS